MTGPHAAIDPREAEDFLRLPRLAVIGAGDDPKKFGHTVYRALRDRPEGQVVAVHPTATTVAGDPAYPSVSAIPEPVDGAIVMVGGPPAIEAVRGALDAGVRHVWLFRGIGGGNGALSDEAVELCHARGATVVAGACPFMFLAPVSGLHRFHRAVRRMKGAIAA